MEAMVLQGQYHTPWKARVDRGGPSRAEGPAGGEVGASNEGGAWCVGCDMIFCLR